MELNLSDLNDEDIEKKLLYFHNSLDKIEHTINVATNRRNTIEITPYEKINLNIFIAYSLNSLYWLYLRTKGIDPNQNEVKNQLKRIRGYMMKAKAAYERKTLRPATNIKIAQRLINHYTQGNKDNNDGPRCKKPKLS